MATDPKKAVDKAFGAAKESLTKILSKLDPVSKNEVIKKLVEEYTYDQDDASSNSPKRRRDMTKGENQ